MSKKGKRGTQPESYKVINPFYSHLKLRDPRWEMLNMAGSPYGATMPDKYLIHPEYDNRLVEFKIIQPSGFVKMSTNQKSDWPTTIPQGLKFWVIAARDLQGEDRYLLREKYYQLLFKPPNCQYILSKQNHKFLYL